MTATVDSSAPTLTAVPALHPHFVKSVKRWDDQEQVHKAVMALLVADIGGPADKRRATGGVLYRYEAVAQKPPRLLVQHLAPLVPRFSADPEVRSTSVGPLLGSLTAGCTVRFRVTLNAVRCQSRSGKRTAVTDVEDLEAYGSSILSRQAGMDVTALGDRPATLLLRRGTTPLWTARYDGVATITDPEQTRAAVLTGVGRAKAYGCGFLSLALLASDGL